MMKSVFFPLLVAALAMLMPAQARAQTSPADVRSSSENILWLDAGSLNLTNNDDVTTWTDRSGNNVVLGASTASGSEFPTYIASDANANSQPVVDFDGSDDRLVVNPFNNMASDAISVIAVFSNSQNNRGLMTYAVTGSEDEYQSLAGNSHTTTNNGNSASGGDTQVNVSTFHVFTSRWQSTGGDLFHYLNTTEELSANISNGLTITNGGVLAIGGEQINNNPDADYSNNGDLNGRLAELIVYNTYLNTAERLLIENYLSAKYGVTITNDYYVGNDAAYIEGIVGIGQESDGAKTSATSAGLSLFESANTLDDGEYIMFGHDGSSIAENATTTATTNLTANGRTWTKTWYLDKTGTADATFVFDFGEAFGSAKVLPADISNYRLVYRSGTTGNFSVVTTSAGPTLQSTDQISFTVANADLADGYYTLGTVNDPVTPVLGNDDNIWYVFQDGDWNDPNTWTLDASTAPLFINPTNDVPDEFDEVIIRNGFQVTVQPTTNNLEVNAIEVQGRLNLTTSTGHDFTTINGNGRISISGNSGTDNFPAGNTTGANGFANANNGGLLLIEGTGFEFTSNYTFNRVRIETTNAADDIILGSDLTINGDLTVRRGTLQFGDGTTTDRTLTVFGDFTVENDGASQDGRVTTAVANARHEFNLYGDFLNEGTASFSQRNASTIDINNEATDGIVDVNFLNASANQEVNCNGETNFYRIEIDKGSNDTYRLVLKASQTGNFVLTGAAAYAINDDINSINFSSIPDADDKNPNALGLKRGTVVIGTNVDIAPLTTGAEKPDAGGPTAYSIFSTAKIEIDGGSISQNDADGGVGALLIYGELNVKNGSLANDRNGIVLRGDGLLRVEGGTVDIMQFRTSALGSGNTGGYVQTGGTVTVDISTDPNNGGNAQKDYATFSLTYPDNVFTMTGGTLHVKSQQPLNNDDISNLNHGGLLFINSDPGNQQVTGGTVIFESSNDLVDGSSTAAADEHIVASRAPFYNVIIRNTSSDANDKIVLAGATSGSDNVAASNPDNQTLTAQDLIVLNDLTIETGTQIRNGDLGFYGNVTTEDYGSVLDLVDEVDEVAVDLYVGGSLIIEADARLLTVQDGPDGNTAANADDAHSTIFFNQTIATETIETFEWDNDPSLDLGGLTVDRTTGNEVRCVSPSPGIQYRIRGALEVLSGTFDQGDITVQAFSSVKNFDRLGTWYTSGPYPTATGTPPDAQIRMLIDDIEVDADGAIFGNVQINANPNNPVEFIGDVVIERFDHQEGTIYIGSNNLRIDEYHSLGTNNYTAAGSPTNLNNATETWIETAVTSAYLRVVDQGRFDNGASNNGDQRMMIITDGNASDGGLTLKVSGNSISGQAGGANGVNNYDNLNQLTFPLGFTTDPGNPDVEGTGVNTYYRPAQVKVSNFSDDGYITIRPVSGELQTTDLSGGEVLQHYWRVTHSDFTDLPTVAYRFYYRNREEVGVADLPAGAANEANYVPGKVLDGGTYQRSFESNTITTEEDRDGVFSAPVDANTRVIIFNGNNTGTTNDDLFDFDATNAPGFTLENANYTAGEADRFVGSPQIFYSRVTSGSWLDSDWIDVNNWSLTAHNGAAAGDYPQAGDIAIIGSATHVGGNSPSHSLNIRDGESVEVAEIQYDVSGGIQARLVVWENATLNFGIIKVNGTGTASFQQQIDPDDTPIITGDFGEYYNTPNALYIFRMKSDGVYNLTPPTQIFPRLFLESGGDLDRIMIFEEDITTNFDFGIFTRATLRTSSDATKGDITVKGNLNIRGILEFGDDADRTVTVNGNVNLTQSSTVNDLVVSNAMPSSRRHRLIVEGNINQSQATARIDLYGGNNPTDNQVILELNGAGNNTLSYSAGAVPELYRIIVDKGTDLSSSFTINDDFVLPTPANISAQPIEIVNGLLILNDAGIDVTLTDAARGNFLLPNTNNVAASSGSGGLEIANGIARILGDDVGILLDGLLRISNNGTLDMAYNTGNGNNYIEYSSSGEAIIDITGNGQLYVGSQVRRGLNATTGVLKYRQSGGFMLVGVNEAPESNRGVFEVLNLGSEFTHTGGFFNLIQSNGSTTVPSLRLSPASHTIADGTIIYLGSEATTQGQTMGVQSSIALDELVIAQGNASTAPDLNLTVEIYNEPLEVNLLRVGGNDNVPTFDCNGFDLTVNETFINQSIFQTSGNNTNQQTTFFPAASAMTLDEGPFASSAPVSTTFFNLNKTGAGTLTVGTDITISNELNLLAGTLATGSSTVTLLGDMIHDGTHTSAAGADGIVFQGAEDQDLGRSTAGQSSFGTLTINNGNGVVVSQNGSDFLINDRLILQSGIFNIGENLLTMNNNATIEDGSGGSARTDFSINNMITVNTSLIDKGLRRIFTDNSNGTYVYPMGLTSYTPFVVQASDIDGTTANTGFITVKPIDDVTGGTANDADELCDGNTDDYVDDENILQYYWLVKSQNVADFDGQFEAYFDDVHESLNNSANYSTISGAADITNYAPARLLNSSNTWDKNYLRTDFDQTNNVIYYRLAGPSDFTGLTSTTIEGRYTAGLTKDDADNFLCGSAIPDDVPVYVTEATGSGSITAAASFATTPTGSPVPTTAESPDLTVAGSFELTLTNQFWRFRRVTIEENATLVITSPGVNLGTVTGSGTIKLVDNSNFPNGDFEDFFPPIDCSTDGGGVEYEVSTAGTQTVLSGLNAVQRAIMSGDGLKQLPISQSCIICQDLDIRDNGTFEMNDDGHLFIRRNILKSAGATFDSDFSNARITLDGTAQQQIDGSFTGTQAFTTLELDNAAGLTIVDADNDDVQVSEELIFTDGLITTDANNRLIISNGADLTNFSSTRYVNGPLVRQLSASTASAYDLFPVGNDGNYGLLQLNDINITAQDDWTVTYFHDDPITNATIDNTTTVSTAAQGAGVQYASSIEYWSIDVNSANNPSANIQLNWNANSDVVSTISNLEILYWDDADTEWELLATEVQAPSGAVASGFLTSGRLSFSEQFVTFGTLDGNVTPLPVDLIRFEAEKVATITQISWSTGQERDFSHFEVQRSTDGRHFYSLGQVAAKGLMDQGADYRYTDPTPRNGVNYYRLKMVDLDGSVTYSPVRSVTFDVPAWEIPFTALVYPNPVSQSFCFVELDGAQPESPISIRLINLQGQTMAEWQATADVFGTWQGQLGLPQYLPSGSYLLQIREANQVISRRILLQRG